MRSNNDTDRPVDDNTNMYTPDAPAATNGMDGTKLMAINQKVTRCTEHFRYATMFFK